MIAASTPKFELPDYSIPEDEGPVEVCITIPDGQLETDITVNLRTAEQTATGIYIYTHVRSTYVYIFIERVVVVD